MLLDVQVATPQPKKVRVLRPDRTAERKGGCENRPILRIACAEPLSRFGLEITIEVKAHQSPECRYGSQERQRLRGVAAML